MKSATPTGADLEMIMKALEPVLGSDPAAPLPGSQGEVPSPTEFFAAAQLAGVPYRRACGFVSRKIVDHADAAKVRSHLFRARHILDSRIEATIRRQIALGTLRLDRLLKRQVFGFCKKQGVSFRLSTSTCVPTKLCGGGCYAHDGRERVTSTILSGCYNTVLCQAFEAGELPPDKLVPAVRKAVEQAQQDQKLSVREFGFERRARLRLAHVGEIAAFPGFAKWLGAIVSEMSGGFVDCVVYTRHPNVRALDTSTMVVNLTLDAASESRRAWLREGVRPVWSAWDGQLDSTAEVNFLEHHDHDQHALPKGIGNVCPVTAASTERRVCDEFRCTRCFDASGVDRHTTGESNPSTTSLPPRRVRHRNMLGEIKSTNGRTRE